MSTSSDSVMFELANVGTRAEALRTCQMALRAGGICDWQFEARTLVAAALSCSSSELIAYPETVLASHEVQRLAECLRRRFAGEPITRIMGERDFYGRTFSVTPATLDPRPDTETLIEVVLKIASAQEWRHRPLHLLDYGTGTGCIGLTLLAEIPRSTAVLADVSAAALNVAERNAVRLDLMGRACFREVKKPGDIVDSFDIVVSNPPYIPTDDIASLPREVRDFDPLVALDGGPEGLDFYRLLFASALSLCPAGWVVVEIGADQSEAVLAIVHSMMGKHIETVELHTDLGGRARCIAAKMKC